ncbi:hypothetical protein MMC28_001585 [Mycoblastus sanguinarius]|nr:hypothetical protein [Mycoblastus sanguinarius]
MPKKPHRTLNVYDKGSNYLLTDATDDTPLYNIHWNGNESPHMVVHRLSNSQSAVGSATYFDKKKGGFFATASDIHLKIHDRHLSMNKENKFFSTDKRAYDSIQGSKFWWKGGYAASQYQRLEDGDGKLWADFRSTAYTGSVMGVLGIYVESVSEEMLDEIVVSGLAMVSEQKTSMTNTAAAISSAGG